MRIKGHASSNPTNHEPSASAGEKSQSRGAVNCGRPCDALGPLFHSFWLLKMASFSLETFGASYLLSIVGVFSGQACTRRACPRLLLCSGTTRPALLLVPYLPQSQTIRLPFSPSATLPRAFLPPCVSCCLCCRCSRELPEARYCVLPPLPLVGPWRRHCIRTQLLTVLASVECTCPTASRKTRFNYPERVRHASRRGSPSARQSG